MIYSYGFSDLGELHRRNLVAKHSLIFLLRGLNTNWKQTVAYYVGAPNGNEIRTLIKIVASKIMSCGFNLVGISNDQGANNRSANRLMEVTAERNY